MIEHINEYLTEQSQIIAKRAYQIVVEKRQSTLGTPHVLLALLEHPDETLLQIFDHMSLDVEQLKRDSLALILLQGKVPFWKGQKYQIFTTPFVKQSVENAVFLSKELKENKASSAHIFWALINSCTQNQHDQIQLRMTHILKSNNIEADKVLELIKKINLT